MRSLVLLLCVGGVASAVTLPKVPFDKPSAKKTTPLPIDHKEVYNQGAEVRCWEYPHFGVKEVDIGDKGAERIAVLPPLERGARRPCTRLPEPGERKLEAQEHYYWGALGDTLLLTSADGANGFSELLIADSKTAQITATIAFQEPLVVKRGGGKIGLAFKTSIDSNNCEYPKDGKACWDKMRANSHVPETMWPAAPPCPKAKHGKDLLPAIVAAPASVADITQPALTFVQGALSCRAKD